MNDLVHQMCSQIVHSPSAWLRLVLPAISSGYFRTMAIEMRLKLDDSPHCSLFEDAGEGKEISIPSAILINCQHDAFLFCQAHQILCFLGSWREWLFDNHILP